MVQKQPVKSDLTSHLKRAMDNYRSTWQTVDSELYDLCRRRSSHRSFADVYTKVAVIGRVYAAGLPRSMGASGDAESKVTHGLISLADLIEPSLGDLVGRQFDRVSAAQIVELHGRVARGLLPNTGETWQQSFVSKYLHFHCDIVPIYDGNAESAIGRFVNRRGLAVRTVRASMTDLPDWARAYRNFVAAFVVLMERISAETPITASVKEVDHMLWQSIG
jgi:hypothetical protein